MAKVPQDWMPKCQMKLIVVHWTAGGHKASALDREHYHIIVEHDGNLVRGDHSIDDNVSTDDDDYAAHTRRCNGKVIGVSVACMAGAIERPFNPGPFPMTEPQWMVMAEVVAELADFYGIPVKPTTILGHGEVEINLDIKQNGKWDPMVLPWKPTLSKAEVGDLFRKEVARHMAMV